MLCSDTDNEVGGEILFNPFNTCHTDIKVKSMLFRLLSGEKYETVQSHVKVWHFENGVLPRSSPEVGFKPQLSYENIENEYQDEFGVNFLLAYSQEIDTQ